MEIKRITTQFSDIIFGIAERSRLRRKEHGLSRKALSEKSGVSFSTIRHFETSGEISLRSLTKIAIALDADTDFEKLFARKHYQSIQEVIDDQR